MSDCGFEKHGLKKHAVQLLSVLALAMMPVHAFAQDGAEPEETPIEAPDQDGEQPTDAPAAAPDAEGAEGTEGTEGDETSPVDAAKEGVEQAEGSAVEATEPTPVEPPPPADPVQPTSDDLFGDSPIADLADAEFVPLDDIEEGALEQIIPARRYPSFDITGGFRTRVRAMMNWDLDTQGTSAILPPAESFTPIGNPINPDKDTHWDANLRLRLEPTLNITERIRVVGELHVLDNLNFGSLPASRLGSDPLTPSLGGVGGTDQLSPTEREFFRSAIQVKELYGEVETLLGKLSVGRMDSHWGLGIRANDGDCEDCDYGVSYERIQFTTKIWELYVRASLDWPDEGLFSRVIEREGGQPYDISQLDDVDQYTVAVFRKPITREERELRGKLLLDDQKPAVDGGLMYIYRQQDGRFVPFYGPSFDPTAPPSLIYRGERLHLIDLWAEFLYEPDFDTRVRVGVEALTWLGRVHNVGNSEVGLPEQAGDDPVNCFDSDQFAAHESRCTTDADGNSTNQNVAQFGLALESEFRFGGPISFGLNAGVASGGDSANWGTASPDLSFYRFNPDYQIDLILFRSVIGTVTNAYYMNPWAMLKVLESSRRHVEIQLDAIGSHAFDVEGTPSGVSPWLGVEFDGAVRYINLDAFTAALEAGILFPFEGLKAMPGRPRYRPFGADTSEFNAELRARIAWTLQAKLFWNF